MVITKNILDKYIDFLDTIEEEVGLLIEINNNNLEKMLIEKIVQESVKAKQNTIEYKKGFSNDTNEKWKGKGSILDFYRSYYVSSIIPKQDIYINDMTKNQITQKTPLSIPLEYHNFPSLLGALFSGKYLNFNLIINTKLEDLEISMDKVQSILSKNENWKEENIITKVFNANNTFEIDKLNLITHIANKEFDLNINTISSLIYGFGLLGYCYNNQMEINIDEKEIVQGMIAILENIQEEPLLHTLNGELYKMDEILYSKIVTII